MDLYFHDQIYFYTSIHHENQIFHDRVRTRKTSGFTFSFITRVRYPHPVLSYALTLAFLVSFLHGMSPHTFDLA